MSSDDLGGLGATDGPPVVYQWTRASLMPLLVPWLAILALLMLKANRSAQAWWIWVALGVVCGLALSVPGWLSLIPSEPRDLLSQLLIALAFGLCALWLLAPSLPARHRLRAALSMFLIVAGFSLFTYFVRADWGEDMGVQTVLFVPLAFTGFALVLALSLAGLACRSHYSAVRFLLSLTGWLLASWAAILVVSVALVSGGSPPWIQVGAAILVCTAISLGCALPFLVLSIAHPFFGDRLRRLLSMASAPTPAPEPEPALAADE